MNLSRLIYYPIAKMNTETFKRIIEQSEIIRRLEEENAELRTEKVNMSVKAMTRKHKLRVLKQEYKLLDRSYQKIIT